MATSMPLDALLGFTTQLLAFGALECLLVFQPEEVGFADLL
jgi:hypothetical protein